MKTQKCRLQSWSRKGFTLIELLAVISIISLLLAIAMPALRFARERAKRLTCATQLKTLTLAALMYAGDNDEKLCVKKLGMDPYPLVLGHQREIDRGYPDLRDMFVGYLPGYKMADGASPLMFCPSARANNNQRRKLLSYDLASELWQRGHYVMGYAYWGAIESNLDAIQLDWYSDVDPPRRTYDRPYTPLFSDPMELSVFHKPYQWGLASHTRNGTVENTSAKPAGQNNACLDGSVKFLKFCENSNWIDRVGFNMFGDLEPASGVSGSRDTLLLWGGIR
jgi:prepilin-type N-terminal cleavage/methylation domain-containing protein